MGVIGLVVTVGVVLMMAFFFLTYRGDLASLSGMGWNFPALQQTSFASSPSPSPHGKSALPKAPRAVSPNVPPAVVIVSVTAAGYTPQTMTIAPGTMVVFVNQDSRTHWPASNPHPSHTACPGFDALRDLKYGESYGFTFVKPGVCAYHDHRSPSKGGTITVK